MSAVVLRFGCAVAFAALTSCGSRVPLPAPRVPLVATPAEVMAGPPEEPMPSEPLQLRRVSRVLSNGFRVELAPGASHGLVSVVFVSRATPRWDARAPALVTRWMVPLAFRATLSEEGQVVDDLLQREGFSPEVSVGASGLLVADHLPREELPRFLRTLDRVLRSPAFRAVDLAHRQEAQADMIEGELANSSGMLAVQRPRMLYAASDPRALTLRDDLRGLAELDVAALRARHADLLDPERGALVITGDLDPVETLPVVGQLFGGWPRHPVSPQPIVPSYRAPRGPRGVVLLRPSLRAYVQLVEHAPPFTHADYPAFLVLEQLLGAMFGARLNLVIRERNGASYGFHAGYLADATEGLLEMETSVEPSAVDTVLRLVLEEVRRVRGEGGGIEAFELSVAKVRARETLLAQVDSSLGLAFAMARRLQAGQSPTAFGDVLRGIDALDAEAVEAAARRWLRPDRAPLFVVARPEHLGGVEGVGAGPLEVVRMMRRTTR